VCKTASNDTAQLLSRENVDYVQLQHFVRQVADYVGIPSSCPFAKNHMGNDDVAIFDFSRKQQAVKHFKICGSEEGNRGLAALVGDALIEPFWPLGTGMYPRCVIIFLFMNQFHKGANRAVLSALDTAWMAKGAHASYCTFYE
jgi:hypothetical protein